MSPHRNDDTNRKKRKTIAGDTVAIFRIIQSIPFPKAEPFKQWMAEVASNRVDQMQDPELSIEQAVMDYKSVLGIPTIGLISVSNPSR